MFEQELGTVAKGAGIAFTGKVSGTGLKYITQIIIARLLGTKLFGIYALGLVICEVAELLSRMGLHLGAVRYVSIYNGKGELQKLKGILIQSICFPFFGGAILGILIFLSSEPLAQNIFGKPELALVLRIFAVSLPFWASTLVAARATTGFQTTKYLVYIKEYLQPFVNLILVILLCLIGLSLFGVTLAWGLSFLLGFLCVLYLIKRIFPPIVQKNIKPVFETKQLFKFSLPLAFGDFMLFFLLRIDIMLLGYFWSSSEVGIYRSASQTALLILIFLISFNNIFAPMIADIISKGDRERIRQIFKSVTRWSFALSLPLFIVVGINAKGFLRIFGSDFAEGWLPLIILAAGQLLNAAAGGVAYMLIMSGHQYQKLVGDLAIVLTNIILNIILIPRWGLIGAAIATSISIAAVNLMRVIQVYLILRVHAYSWNYLRIIGVSALSAPLGLFIRNLLQAEHYILSLVVTSVIILVVYALLFWGICFEDTDKIILERIRHKLKLFVK
ncbi:flippase [Candidatus Woesearchaeota archaeon]|nr:flippase [Candidatus Woesearchaeota archaeon]